ncbi:MAG: MFS transporter [Herminiimonas sp.]|nr:MFS transporter [Herminiimonas sp.]
MTTCVVVRKDNQIAIAADSLVTFGDTRLSSAYEANRKILSIGSSYVTLAGTAAHFPVMRKLLTDMGEECRLGNRDEVFTTFSRVHQILKENYFLNTKEDEDDPYESSQITALIANPRGIYGVYSYREVFSFDRFWGIGSGRNFALGAMYAAYDGAHDARAIAEIGVRAGAEFDKSSAAPFQIISFEMQPVAESGTPESAQ